MFAGEVYLKGAIKNYAKEVGLDSDEIIKLYHKLKNERETYNVYPALSFSPKKQNCYIFVKFLISSINCS